MTELKNVSRETEVVTVKGAIIKQVSSPSTIQRVAVDRNINPQEVFVRVIFEHEGKEYSVSNKLRFLTKAGYVELTTAKESKKPIDLAVDVKSGFFYIEKNISVDDLFKVAVKSTKTATDLSTLLKA